MLFERSYALPILRRGREFKCVPLALKTKAGIRGSSKKNDGGDGAISSVARIAFCANDAPPTDSTTVQRQHVHTAGVAFRVPACIFVLSMNSEDEENAL